MLTPKAPEQSAWPRDPRPWGVWWQNGLWSQIPSPGQRFDVGAGKYYIVHKAWAVKVCIWLSVSVFMYLFHVTYTWMVNGAIVFVCLGNIISKTHQQLRTTSHIRYMHVNIPYLLETEKTEETLTPTVKQTWNVKITLWIPSPFEPDLQNIATWIPFHFFGSMYDLIVQRVALHLNIFDIPRHCVLHIMSANTPVCDPQSRSLMPRRISGWRPMLGIRLAWSVNYIQYIRIVAVLSMYRLCRFFSKKVQLSLNALRTYLWESKQSYVSRTTIYTCCILLVPCPMLCCYHQQKCGVVAPLVVLLLLPSILVLLWYYKKYKPQAPTRGAFTIAVGDIPTMECLLNLQ